MEITNNTQTHSYMPSTSLFICIAGLIVSHAIPAAHFDLSENAVRDLQSLAALSTVTVAVCTLIKMAWSTKRKNK